MYLFQVCRIGVWETIVKITENGGLSYKEELDTILDSDLPEMDKLAAAFGGLTGFVVEVAEKEIELAKAMGDRQETIKQQIKMETMNGSVRNAIMTALIFSALVARIPQEKMVITGLPPRQEAYISGLVPRIRKRLRK